ncbi:MAG: sodium:proton antiporter [Bacteroidetes bacterium GWF2_38_335]|nr:MAG: sodium:proton antiporter [Bacteroidetes bacterium GWF2_38_335]OFY77912.1 MAG: sodium:proton antiporter [Bacteroidetes bacterium RIFOXYA12_FULL_38_20]HBS86651.1 sodium:proton antiporter [Bacteroidales bacterium]
MNDFFELIKEKFTTPLQEPVLVFSLIFFIILLAPIVLKRFNIPGIIGLILSGVIFGPHGLNFLENNSFVQLFSFFGMIYIIFIAGLDLNLNEFKATRNRSILFGFLTFIFPIFTGFPVCYYLLDFDFNASFIISIMFATRTLVAYPIVSKLGLTKNQAVPITVGGTIIADTAVLVIFAIIMQNNQGTLNQEYWIRMAVSLAFFLVIMFYIVPRISKWFFKKLESEKHSHYIYVLSVVFLAAFLAEIAGFEAIIGAFVAGLALNSLIPQSSALMNRIEFIGNALFIPFFLISVGMIVDLSFLLNGPMEWIIAGAFTIAALTGKWLAAFLTQLLFKYSVNQRNLIFGLSSSHAAASLAIILLAHERGILDKSVLNGTIILILITCIIASFITERSAKKIVLSSDRKGGIYEISPISKSENIMLPIANFHNFEKLLDWAILIKEKKSVNPVSILSVVPNNEQAEINMAAARDELEKFVNQASASETKVKIITTIDHNPSSGILRTSREIMADIIIMGWPQKAGMIEKLIGEKVDNIINGTDKTIFICSFEKPIISIKKIVVIIPPYGEKENGFDIWFNKIIDFGQELSKTIYFHCNALTEETIKNKNKVNKNTTSVNFVHFNEWDDFFIISRHIRPDDLIILSSARKGAASYISILENLPSKIEKYFPDNSRIAIYPQQHTSHHIREQYENISSESFSKGIQTVQKFGKGISNIFKKEELD